MGRLTDRLFWSEEQQARTDARFRRRDERRGDPARRRVRGWTYVLTAIAVAGIAALVGAPFWLAYFIGIVSGTIGGEAAAKRWDRNHG